MPCQSPFAVPHLAGPVHVDPEETTLVWAYGFDWRPVPVFQRYAAYTRRSDGGNAEALTSDETAPSRIIRHQSDGFEGRNDLWDSPRYMLNLVCFYRQTMVSSGWQLLEHVGLRCGGMRFGPRFAFRRGRRSRFLARRPKMLSSSRSIYKCRFGSGFEPQLFRPTSRITVTADRVDYFVPTTQVAGPLLLRVPPQVGWDREFGGRVAYKSLRVNMNGTARFAIFRVRG